MSENRAEWHPYPGPQTQFLRSGAYEVLFGGAAGPGKSEVLLVAPLRWVNEPSFRAILFRRTFPELEKSLIDRSRQLYRSAFPTARYNDQKKFWSFPSGARVYFGHLEHEHDVHQYQGAEFQYIGFDECTHFAESQFKYLLSRARTSRGVPVRIRAASNPGGPGHDWIFSRFGPWLNPDHAIKAQPGEVLWYLNTNNGEEYVPKGTPGSLSRTFIPGRLSDNRALMESDPGYADRLRGMDPVTRERLLNGDWTIREAPGLYFRRSWFEIIDTAPAHAARVRYWDRAGTKELRDMRTGKSLNDPDYTVGLRLARTAAGEMIVEDVVRLRGDPGEVQRVVKQTSQNDGVGVHVALEQDPGQAGKFEVDSYIKQLFGYHVHAIRPSGDKVLRAGPASSQAKAGNIKLLKGPWNKAFLEELEAFPSRAHDDQVDALSGAVNSLAFPAPQARRDLRNLPPA